MKRFGTAAMMTTLAAAMGTTPGLAGDRTFWTVAACINQYGPEAVLIGRARGVASKLLTQVGVKLVWKSDMSFCANGAGLVVTLSRQTARTNHPGALAYALPFEKTHIEVFLDRVQQAADESVTPFLLGYVLAHEVTHMLQWRPEHSASGVMKARWNLKDYGNMKARRVRFGQSDADLVRRGMEWLNRTTIASNAPEQQVRATAVQTFLP